jgi:tetratricopeptide (TPR) repeat protein
VVRVTVKERILLHLLEFAKYAESFDVPPALTQTGIARAVRIELPHVAQYMHPLIGDGLVRERTAHVQGGARKRKAYDLTNAGRMAAIRLRETVRAEVVRIREPSGTRDASVALVLQQAGPKASLLEVVVQAMESGAVDLASVASKHPAPGAYVERLADAPRIVRFVGRKAELDRLTRTADRGRVIVIRGIAGIGKTSLAARACERLRGTRNLFWHRIRPWDTRQSILANLAEFLAAIGRPGLKSVLARGDSARIDDVVRQDLGGLRASLVFDDAHASGPEVLALFRFLGDVIATAQDVTMIVLTRRKLPFYDRRDVLLSGSVEEIDLQGLGADEVAEFLDQEGRPEAFVDLGRAVGGHPLSLELLRSAPAAERALRDVERFVEEEIYRELSDPERAVMKVASLYQVPVPREVLLSLPPSSHDVLLSLEGRALLRRLRGDTYGVHDTIREFFAGLLTPVEREELGGFAADMLRHLAERAEQAGDLVLSINCLSNALGLLPEGVMDASLLERLADAHERIGDSPAALDAYRRALGAFDTPEARARIHRKMAHALEDRGDVASASAEVDAGLRALGGTATAERGWLDLIRCRIAYRLADWEQARDAGDSALDTLRDFGVAEGTARAHLILGHIAIHSPQNDAALAEKHLTEALAASDAVDLEFVVDVRIALAHLLAWHRGNVDAAVGQALAIDELQAALDLPQARRKFRLFQGMFRLIFFADYAAAEANFRAALEEAAKIHELATVANAKVGLGYMCFFQGRFSESRQLYEEAAAELKAQGLLADAVNIVLAISEAYFLEGNQPAAFETLGVLVTDESLARAVGSRGFYVRLTEGYTHLIQGERDEAYAALLDAVRRAEGESGLSEGTMTYDFVGCISWPAIYALLYSGVALRFLGKNEEGTVQIAKAMELARSRGAKAWLEVIPKVEPRLVEVLQSLLAR